MYLLDSDFLINFLKGKEKEVKFIHKATSANLSTSIICIGEVLEGLYATNNEDKTAQFEQLITKFKSFEINREVINEFALLRANLRTQGKLIDNLDLLIAATCMAYNLTLVTSNISHFKRIPKLKIYRE